jgi:hypothetical protein
MLCTNVINYCDEASLGRSRAGKRQCNRIRGSRIRGKPQSRNRGQVTEGGRIRGNPQPREAASAGSRIRGKPQSRNRGQVTDDRPQDDLGVVPGVAEVPLLTWRHRRAEAASTKLPASGGHPASRP